MIKLKVDDEVVRISCDLFCAEALITFDGIDDDLIVPIEAFNYEVSKKCYQINPIECENGIECKVKLPDVNLQWKQALICMEKYFQPEKQNKKKITNSPALDVQIDANALVPFAYLLRRLHFDRIFQRIVNSMHVFSYNSAIKIVTDLCTNQLIRNSISEILDPMIDLLSSNIMVIPASMFKGFDIAPAVVSIFQIASQKDELKDDPKCIIQWLLGIFEHFTKKQEYMEEIMQILSKLRCTDSKAAFTVWLYSQIIDEINGADIFMPFVSTFALREYYHYLYYVKGKSIEWLLDNLDLKLNEKYIVDLVCNWISPKQNHPYHEKCFVYQSAKQKKIFNIEKLQGDYLVLLIPYALEIHDNAIVDEIIKQIKSELPKWSAAITTWNDGLNKLPFDSLQTAFDLYRPPFIENLSKKQVKLQIAANFYQIDKIFYKWISAHPNTPVKFLNEYLDYPTTQMILSKKPHRILKILDLIYEIDHQQVDQFVNTYLYNVTSWKDIFLHYSKKSTNLNFKTAIFQHVKKAISKQDDLSLLEPFCRVLESFSVKNYQLLIPFTEQTVHIALRMFAKEENKEELATIEEQFLTMAKLCMGSFSIDELKLLITLFNIDHCFNSERPFFGPEDRLLAAILETKQAQDINLSKYLNLQHLSLKTTSLLDKSINDFIDFSFEPTDLELFSRIQAVASQYQLDYIKINDQLNPPRVGYYAYHNMIEPNNTDILSILVLVFSDKQPRIQYEISRAMSFIGLTNFTVKFVVSEPSLIFPQHDTVIAWQPLQIPPNDEIIKKYQQFLSCLESLKEKNEMPSSILINVAAVQIIQQYFNKMWEYLFPDYFTYSTENVPEDNYHYETGKWFVSGQNLLPEKQDLIQLKDEDYMNVFHLSYFKLDDAQKSKCSHIIQCPDDYLFACVFKQSPLALFNFDLVYFDDLIDIPHINIIRRKQCIECIYSLITVTKQSFKPLIFD